MVARIARATKKEASASYFPNRNYQFIKTGCTLLDCVLGGGWALGLVANIVGDKSVGKTLLAIEAAANFVRAFPNGKVFYREAEAAFDVDYARSLGLPLKSVDFGEDGPDTLWDTIEDIFEDLEKQLEICKKSGNPSLYIIDSLDALGSREGLERKIDAGSYDLEKQKKLSKLFSRLVRRMRSVSMALLIISQVRDNIGALMFGPKHRRSGGKSLDFYASHILWLSHLKTLKRTVGGEKRATGVLIKAKCTKNKVGLPHRECEFAIRFGFGVDELNASLDYLSFKKRLKLVDLTEAEVDKYVDTVEALPQADYDLQMEKLQSAVKQVWAEVDEAIKPTRQKYA